MIRRAIPCALVLAGVLCVPAAADDEVRNLLTGLEAGADAPEYWATVSKMESLGRDGIADAEEGLRRANVYVRIGCAKYLYRFKKADAVATLARVAESDDARAAQVAADLMANLTRDDAGYGDADDLGRRLQKRMADAPASPLKVALARALGSVTGGTSLAPVRVLRELVRSDDPALRHASALALAEMEDFGKDVVEALKSAAREPGERGRLAGAYLLLNRLQTEVSQKTFEAPGGKYALLDEILSVLRAQYSDPEKVKEQDLVEAAAKGLAGALDPYTAYLDEKEYTALRSGLEGKYGGIGARVTMRRDQGGNAWLTIERPIYSGPAYKAGLRSMDRFTEIEGEAAVNRDLEELVSRLRGDPGSTVRFKVYRRGWKEPVAYELIREKITLDTVIHEVLPGGVGYLHLTTFGPQTAPLTGEALRDMEGRGIKALVLDLRGNSGGLLKSAVDVAEKFVPKGSLVVTVRGRDAVEKHVTRLAPHPNYPLVVLVDAGSASASEILAGALQHYGRAVCVGERSFGKGSVQQLPELQSTKADDRLRITIAKYYLPSGRSPQREKDAKTWGVEPDMKVEPPERDFWKDSAFEKIRQSGKIDDYIKERLPQHKELFRELAADDGGDPARYPDLPKLLGALEPPLNRQLEVGDLREIVRDGIRRWAADDRGKDLTFDFQLDTVLQAGILEALKRAGVDPKGIPAYSQFADKPPETKASGTGEVPLIPRDQ